MSPKIKMLIGQIVLLIVALGISTSDSLGQTQTSPPTKAQVEAIQQKLASALKFADQSWARVFQSNSARFQMPEVVYGGSDAVYVGNEHKIYLNMGFLWQNVHRAAEMTKFQDDGDLGAIIILWHEYGHSIQRMLGVKFAHTIDYELQADCLAGATFAMAEQARLIDPGDEDEAHNSLLYARDSSGTRHTANSAHGTGGQRITNFDRGRKGGVNACQLPWPQTLSRR